MIMTTKKAPYMLCCQRLTGRLKKIRDDLLFHISTHGVYGWLRGKNILVKEVETLGLELKWLRAPSYEWPQ